MKKLLLTLTTLSLVVALFESCKPKVVDLNKMADKIEAQWQGKPYGYAFVISRLGQPSVERAWGAARRPADPPEMPMSVDVKYTTASVSKNITAAAVLKLLDETDLKQQGLNLDQKLDAKIIDYLPYNWKPGAGVDTITFRELLKHRAGIRCMDDFVDYQNLKKCLAKGVEVSNKGKGCKGETLAANQTGCYLNTNYALFRAIIPVMLGTIKKPVLSTFTEEQTDTENALVAANVYIKYMNDNVYSKAGLPQIFCKATDGKKQGITYKHAAPDAKGTDYGDNTLWCGSQGWVLSAAQLATYFQTLNSTNTIVSPAIALRMRTELLGYDNVGEFNSPDGKVTYWWKPGGHPASNNPGEINTLLIHYSNGVEVAVVINSDFDPAGFDWGSVITNSLSDVLNGK